MEKSIFSKIIKGEIPCHKVYEDELTFAFMDIHPIQAGHVLVLSKKQVNEFQDLPDEDYQALFITVKKVANKIKETLDPARVCVRIEGFDVPHVHVHVYPCNTAREFYGERDRQDKEPDHPALAQMATKLRFK